MNDIIRLEQQLRAAKEAEFDARENAHQIEVDRIKLGMSRRRTLGLAPPRPPLGFLAIGDSWFEYPLNDAGLPWVNTAIVANFQLKAMGHPPPLILSHALHGQAMTAIMSWESQQRMATALADRTRWPNETTGLPDAILLSGGGNDLVGDQFAIYLDFDGNGLNASRFQGVLGSILASYMDLFALRDRFAPGIPIFGHCYDYGIPNNAHPIFAGPWLHPSLAFCGYDYDEGLTIVTDAINNFRKMLSDLAHDVIKLPGTATNNFVLVDTVNTLTRDASPPNGWANEIHPYTAGFTALARKFLVALQARFPGRI